MQDGAVNASLHTQPCPMTANIYRSCWERMLGKHMAVTHLLLTFLFTAKSSENGYKTYLAVLADG